MKSQLADAMWSSTNTPVDETRLKTQCQEVGVALFYRQRQYKANGCVIRMDLHVRNLLSSEEGYELGRRDYNCYDPVFVVEMRGEERETFRGGINRDCGVISEFSGGEVGGLYAEGPRAMYHNE